MKQQKSWRMSCDVGWRMSRAHSPTFPSLHLHHSSFSNLSVTSPTSQLILQPFCCFTYVTAHFPTLPLLHLHRSSFSNPSVACPMSQALHLRHLVSCPWPRPTMNSCLRQKCTNISDSVCVACDTGKVTEKF